MNNNSDYSCTCDFNFLPVTVGSFGNPMCLFISCEETKLAWFFWFGFLFSMFVSSPDTYISLNSTWHKVSKHWRGWYTAQCRKQTRLTLGHMGIITDSKKYNTTQNTGRSHNKQQIQNVPWEGERGREEEKERRKSPGNRIEEHVHDRLYISRGISPKALQRSSAELYNRQKTSERGTRCIWV